MTPYTKVAQKRLKTTKIKCTTLNTIHKSRKCSSIQQSDQYIIPYQARMIIIIPCGRPLLSLLGSLGLQSTYIAPFTPQILSVQSSKIVLVRSKIRLVESTFSESGSHRKQQYLQRALYIQLFQVNVAPSITIFNDDSAVNLSKE